LRALFVGAYAVNRRHLSFRQLEVFAAVARERSFTRAADRLHLTQPAVSIQMQKLAESIGQPLFELVGREVRLTEIGRELLATCASIDDTWERFESALAGHHKLERGRLRVSTVMTAKYFLPRMLGQFCRRYPGIEVELEVLNRERIVNRLREGLDDLYVMGVPPDDLDVVTHPFLENQLIVIAPLDFASESPTPLQLSDLAHQRFILREVGSGTRRVIDSHLADTGVRFDVKLSLGSNEAIREAVAGGMGLAVLSRHALPARPEELGVRILDVAGFPLRRHWYIVHPRARLLPLAAQAFLDELLAVSTAPAPSQERGRPSRARKTSTD
jgi:DNA-binding transcriptional LysR family regulator